MPACLSKGVKREQKIREIKRRESRLTDKNASA